MLSGPPPVNLPNCTPSLGGSCDWTMNAISPRKTVSSGTPKYLAREPLAIFFSAPAFSSMMTKMNSTMIAPA